MKPALDDPKPPASEESGTLEAVLYNKPGHLIRRLQQIAVGIFLEEAGALDLTPVQYAVLETIHAQPGRDQISLANAIGFDRTTIGGVLDRLENKGLVARQVPAHDRRSKVLLLTDAGSAILRDIQAASDRAQRRMLDPLGPAEREALMTMLSRVVWHHNSGSRTPVRRAAEEDAAAPPPGSPRPAVRRAPRPAYSPPKPARARR
ncbi:MarR family winged helix-turn-helix transcriptional regulator [Roseomonas sp. BN140053]|uniref:MarR family winged helix-turn-helix transcriptional regulator n=1 Tax=Roseomonas sp. BN140053 TaxID=3391898 RepID=UPI0039EB7797